VKIYQKELRSFRENKYFQNFRNKLIKTITPGNSREFQNLRREA
jgi:hypothetical protein